MKVPNALAATAATTGSPRQLQNGVENIVRQAAINRGCVPASHRLADRYVQLQRGTREPSLGIMFH
jgi:hypothetical protein